jgi:hypothetical protein
MKSNPFCPIAAFPAIIPVNSPCISICGSRIFIANSYCSLAGILEIKIAELLTQNVKLIFAKVGLDHIGQGAATLKTGDPEPNSGASALQPWANRLGSGGILAIT